MRSCPTCQARKKKSPKKNEPMRPIPTPSRPFYMLGCDAVGPIDPISKNNNRYLLVAIDYLTRWPMAKAVPDITEETTSAFLYDIVKDYGVPSYLLTDRGSNFTSRYTKAFLNNLECRHLTTTAYRPQTNGMCERLNQTLVQTLAKIIRDKDAENRWDEYVGAALLAIRTMPNESTKYSPAMLLFGYEMRTPSTWPAPQRDYIEGEIIEEVERRTRIIQYLTSTLHAKAKETAEKEKKRQKQRYDQDVHLRRRFKLGEQVLMKDSAPVGKFSDRWIGPLTVTRVNDSGTYHLQGPDMRRLQGAVNGDKLVPYYQHKRMIPDVQVQQAAQRFEAWIDRHEPRQ